MAEIDLSAIEAQIAAMTPEEIKKQLTDIKTRQKITTKKYYNPEAAKKQRQKKAAEIAAMVEAAKKLGIYDQVMAEAGVAADAKLADAEGEQEAA